MLQVLQLSGMGRPDGLSGDYPNPLTKSTSRGLYENARHSGEKDTLGQGWLFWALALRFG